MLSITAQDIIPHLQPPHSQYHHPYPAFQPYEPYHHHQILQLSKPHSYSHAAATIPAPAFTLPSNGTMSAQPRSSSNSPSSAASRQERRPQRTTPPPAASSSSGPSSAATATTGPDLNSDASVAQALEIARESPDGATDPTISGILEAALSRIWAKVQTSPRSYVMTRDEFAVFNFFQHRFKGDDTAVQARKRYWDNARA